MPTFADRFMFTASCSIDAIVTFNPFTGSIPPMEMLALDWRA